MAVKAQLAVARKLGKELLQSREYVNNAPLLLASLNSSSSSQVLSEALLSLQAFFVPLVKSGEFSPSAQRKASEALQKPSGKRGRDGEGKGEEEVEMAKADAIYKKWIWDRYREFVNTLLRFVARHNAMPEVQVLSLRSGLRIFCRKVTRKFILFCL